MTEPFNANEFRRQQMAPGPGPGQGPQGQPPIPQPVAQPHMPQPTLQPHMRPQPQLPPQFQPQPQYAPQPYQQTVPQPPHHAQAPQPQMPPQAYAQAQQPQPHSQPQPYAQPPHAVEAPPTAEKKSRFKRGAKKVKVKKVKEPREKRETSPFLVFATGLVAGVLLTIMGLRFVGNTAEVPVRETAAVTAIADAEMPSDLASVQTQLDAVKGLDAPAKP